jgi:putative ABC transport system permease protein
MKQGHQTKPPRLANRLFKWFCGDAFVEDISGDIDELFFLNLNQMSPWKARLKYWQQVFSLILSYAVQKRKLSASYHAYSYSTFNRGMFNSYFKIAWRVINRSRVHTMINVLGLAMGICASLVIYTIVHYEFSFDRFHPDKERVFRVLIESKKGDDRSGCICTPPPAASEFQSSVASLESVAGYYRYEPNVSVPNGVNAPRHFERQRNGVILTDAGYFQVFQYHWLAGNAAGLASPFRVVLTASRAKEYFGTTDLSKVLGREIIYDDSLHTVVAGVVEDWNENSDFRMTDFISKESIKGSFLSKQFPTNNWGMLMHYSQTFVKIRKGTLPQDVAQQMTATYRPHADDADGVTTEVVLQPLDRVHFNNNDEGESTVLSTLYTLMGLAGFILLIAVINYINLSTALSLKRAREIGVRKVLGGMRKTVVTQFMIETVLVVIAAVAIAILFVKPVMWGFSSFINQSIEFDVLDLSTIGFLIFLTVFTSVLAGSYPAWVISSYRPVVSLRGNAVANTNDGSWLRKSLIVFQFSLSLVFIIGTLVVSNQMNFIRTKNRGFVTDGVITLRTNWNDQSGRVQTLAANLRQLTGIDNAAMQFFPPMGFALMRKIVTYKGERPLETEVSIKAGDENYIPAYGIQLIAGRNISAADGVKELVINNSYSRMLGFQNPADALGESLYLGNEAFEIVGVSSDFHEQSFRQPIGPTIIGNFPDVEHGIAIKLASGYHDKLPLIISQIEKEFRKVYPNDPFDYHFIEDEIQWMHESERRTAQLLNVATAVTILISCLGIFGLAMYTARVKTKEIGVRKVLGASVTNIVTMLSRQFVVLIVIAFVIATPIAWYFMNDWLLGFAYREEMSIWLFLLAGATALSVALLTLSFQTVRAAMANPVESLRTE